MYPALWKDQRTTLIGVPVCRDDLAEGIGGVACQGNLAGRIERSRDRTNAVGEKFQEVADLATQLWRPAEPFQDLICLFDRLATDIQDGKQHEAQTMPAALQSRDPVGTIHCQDVSPRFDPLAIVHVKQSADHLEEKVFHSALLDVNRR